ncbi:MAG: cysteine desulfurase [Alphaproteobacteria bacterium]|nr:cysteine desulfurase [Alphaproteobacteria bacterium]
MALPYQEPADMTIFRADFPVLAHKMNDRPLAYLDSGASAQKPLIVINAIRDAYESHYANIHRGLYHFSQAMTYEFERARKKVADFLGVDDEREIVFTRNATEGINLVAQSWARTALKPGDEVILTGMEHHANIVPWQLLRDQIGIVLKMIPVREDGTLDLAVYKGLLSERTRLVAAVHVSNALGTVNDVAALAKTAKTFNPAIRILIDGSQAVVHRAVDIPAIGCDFYVMTGHKLYGPTGIGALWGRYDLLAAMPPYQGGGDMIERVTFEETTYKDPPARFEAGTPAIAEAIGLGAAIDYVRMVGIEVIAIHEKQIYDYTMAQLATVGGLRFYGTAPDKAGIISLTADWAHISDIGMILDQCGVAVRTGHHCCMPLMQRFEIDGTLRASLGLYTNKDDIDAFVGALKKAKEMLG